VARRTRESLQFCEAAGFDTILVETVGVGQSEVQVRQLCDVFLLLLQAGAGDDLQGIKRGIMEMADLILVNKADGDLQPAANRTVSDYRNALRLLHPKSKHWQVPVRGISSLEQRGVDEVWQTIGEFWALMQQHGEIDRRRAEQARAWMWNEIQDGLMSALRNDARVTAALPALEDDVARHRLPPTIAAQRALQLFLDKSN
jgi:LAO/AO transport system kinase